MHTVKQMTLAICIFPYRTTMIQENPHLYIQ